MFDKIWKSLQMDTFIMLLRSTKGLNELETVLLKLFWCFQQLFMVSIKDPTAILKTFKYIIDHFVLVEWRKFNFNHFLSLSEMINSDG